MRADLDRFRRELGTDYIDILLLHCMMDGNWPARRKGAMEVLAEAREKGDRAHARHLLPYAGGAEEAARERRGCRWTWRASIRRRLPWTPPRQR